MRRMMSVLAAVLALGVFAAGCGSDSNSSDSSTSDSGTSSTSSLTKAEFLAQGNAICAAGNKEINAGFESLGLQKGEQPTEAQIDQVVTATLLPSVERQVGEIRDLGAPAEISASVTTFLDAADAEVERVKADPKLAVTNSAFADVNKQANAIGLTECGS